MADRLLWALLITVGLAPLPFASNRPWAWGLLGLWVGLQLMGFAVAAFFEHDLIGMSWRRYRLAVPGFALLVIWSFAQQSTLTPETWHDPLWQEAGALLGEPLKGAIAIDPAAARATILRLVAYAGIFFLALQHGRSAERARLVLWSLAVAGSLYSVYGLVIHLGGFETVLWYEKWTYRESLTATFVNRNNFATYAGLSLIAALALLRQELEPGLRYGLTSRYGLTHFVDSLSLTPYVLFVATTVIATALLLTQSRAGFLSTAIGVLVLVVALRLARRRREGTSLRRAILLLAVAAVMLLSVSGGGLMARFGDTPGGEESRGSIYALTLRAIADHPMEGVGLGGFHEAFEGYRDSRLDFAFATVDRAHNTYLELALELGLPAFAVLLALLAGIALVCARGLFVRHRDRIYPAAGLAATALVGLHSSVDFSLQMPAVAATYALLMGTAYAQSYSTHVSGVRAPGGLDDVRDRSADTSRRSAT